MEHAAGGRVMVVKGIQLLLLGLVLLMQNACSVGGGSKLLFENHPLNHKIWQVEKNRFVQKDFVFEQILNSDYILLGETHDNPVHHGGQVEVLKVLDKRFRGSDQTVSVVFEMINTVQGEKLKQVEIDSTDQMIKVLNQDKNGWSYGSYYRQLFEAVLDSDFEVVSASLHRDDLLKYVMKDGDKHLPATIKTTMNNNLFNEQQKESLKQEIIESHCNMANDGMVAGMTRAQRIKDAFMSNRLMDKAKGSVKVLIAGSGHVRDDRGVPMYMRQRDASAKITALAFIEVLEGENEIEYYTRRWGEDGMPFDYVWFTARVYREDPCEAYRRYMKKKHDKAKEAEKNSEKR